MRHPMRVYAPGTAYNAMFHPIVPFAARGVIWYQGETNVTYRDGLFYHYKMLALIRGWRQAWKDATPSNAGMPGGDFPFYFVQLGPYRYGLKHADGKRGNWGPGDDVELLPAIWEAQRLTLSEPDTGMVVTTDLFEDVDELHPWNKRPVGERLAGLALSRNYGRKDLICSGPLYKSKDILGSSIRIQFDHTGKGLKTRDGKDLTYFEIAGDDKAFVPATAVIEKNTVIVSSSKVKKPVAVRFAWDYAAQPNLVNSAGLPASPFHTEMWWVNDGVKTKIKRNTIKSLFQ